MKIEHEGVVIKYKFKQAEQLSSEEQCAKCGFEASQRLCFEAASCADGYHKIKQVYWK